MSVSKRARTIPDADRVKVVEKALRFHEVMGLVRFHHKGCLDSFEADEEVVFRKLHRAYKITGAADTLIYGEYDQSGYREPPVFVPDSIAEDAISEIREFLPELITDLVDYKEVEYKIRCSYQESCRAFDRARQMESDLAWQAITDARRLAIEPLTRAAMIVYRRRFVGCTFAVYGETSENLPHIHATVVRELRGLVPDIIVNLVDPIAIFNKVACLHRMAESNCTNHPHPRIRRRVFYDGSDSDAEHGYSDFTDLSSESGGSDPEE